MFHKKIIGQNINFKNHAKKLLNSNIDIMVDQLAMNFTQSLSLDSDYFGWYGSGKWGKFQQ